MTQPATLSRAVGSQKSVAGLYKLVVSLAILLSTFVVAALWHLGDNSMIACGFLGAFFIYLGARPGLRHVGLAMAAGGCAVLVFRILGGTFSAKMFPFVLGLGAFLGVGSILVMAFDKVWTGSSRYTTALTDALILPVFSLLAGVAMQFANDAPRLSFDYFLYRFDASLGLTPGRTIGALFQSWPLVKTTSSLFYGGLLVFPPLYHGWAAYQGKPARVHLMHAFVVAGVVGFVLYQICPGVGLVVTFGRPFPDRLPSVSAVPAKAFLSTSVHNAMPSMHMTWALLVWTAAWELGPLAVAVASVFILFTGLATVGFGEHYLIDLVVSVPLLMAVHGICSFRHQLTVAGLGMVVAWTVYLRTGMGLPGPIHWLFVAATIAITSFLMWPVRKTQTTRRV
jgi:hypothetical protein